MGLNTIFLFNCSQVVFYPINYAVRRLNQIQKSAASWVVSKLIATSLMVTLLHACPSVFVAFHLSVLKEPSTLISLTLQKQPYSIGHVLESMSAESVSDVICAPPFMQVGNRFCRQRRSQVDLYFHFFNHAM